MPRQSASPEQTSFDRLVWPIALVLLAAGLATALFAMYQSVQLSHAYNERDRDVADASATVVENFLRSRLSEQDEWVGRNPDAFLGSDANALAARIRSQYLTAAAPSYVLGVIVTRPDGAPLVAVGRTPDPYRIADLTDDLAPLAKDVAANDRPDASGRLLVSEGHKVFAYASPLDGAPLPKTFGSWISIYDLDKSPVGVFFGRAARGKHAVGALVDGSGELLTGDRRLATTDRDVVRLAVEGTSWRLALPKTSAPHGVPPWLFAVLAIAIVCIGAFLRFQEGARRTLQLEADEYAARAFMLYALANRLLHSSSRREQAQALGAAMIEGADVDGARVVIDAEDPPERFDVGAVEERAEHTSTVELAGPLGRLGEVRVYDALLPIDEERTHVLVTMCAMAGAAMHTLTVLERERNTAVELQALDELRTNLLSTVAHELRSPLTAIKGVLDLLGFQGDLSDKQREYVELATQRTDALVALIQDMFDCSLIEAGQLGIKPERRDAWLLLSSALGALEASRTGELVLIEPEEPVSINADPLRFDQVVNNLVTNAFRHGRAPIEVSVRRETDGVWLVVADHGAGIAEEERARVFGKFYQSDSGNARLVEGAGMGLALVQGLVQLHGGTIDISATNPDGSGCTISALFPDDAQPRDGVMDTPAIVGGTLRSAV